MNKCVWYYILFAVLLFEKTKEKKKRGTLNAVLGTALSSPVFELSISSNNFGKLSQRLKHRLQPWHISNTRRISCGKVTTAHNAVKSLWVVSDGESRK
jgi:hypothetical protein